MYYIINNDGMRLCEDNRWRDFDSLGEVKMFKSLVWAVKRARQVGGRVVRLPSDVTLDYSGKLYREVPTIPGYSRVEHLQVEEFIVK